MDFIMRMKHWQVFLFVALPFLLMFLVIPTFVLLKPAITVTVIMFPLLAVWIISFISYILFLGISIDKFANFPKKPNKKNFSGLMIYSFIYSLLFIFLFTDMGPMDDLHNVMPKILPFHLLAMLSNIYGIRFIAKMLVSIEKGEIVKAGDYLGEFFLFWFIPVGIWVLQPRINKIAKNA